ncbi:4-coumarate--CoA ligase [Rhizobiales bacterium GAS188]|nr:4-coumarate--CoA ligase [Rhizobiales bacterium GAS188]
MTRPMRPVRLGEAGMILDKRQDGTIYARSPVPLGPYPKRLTERLAHWANLAPDRIFLAERVRDGDWRRITYGEALAFVRRIGTALLARDLSPERPIAILSDNGIDHALLGLAAMHVGIPYAPISAAYSLMSSDFGKLRQIMQTLTPGLVFAADGQRFGAAIAAAIPPDAEILVTEGEPQRGATGFAELAATPATQAVDTAHRRTTPDSIAKFLFTSGSTGAPKGVINTQRMLCANQEMIAAHLAFLREEPPVLVDWLPWNHTFGGNHNVGLTVYNGGSLYIDEGKPMPGAIERTVRNLREIAPTVYFNVPRGFEALVPYFRKERPLRELFFSRLKLMFYAGAGLSQHVWDDLEELALETCGERIAMITGLGSTETAPSALFTTLAASQSGAVGVPLPGVDVKLAPVGDKLEGRVRGPSITPGYWREEAITRKAFDEEGYYCFGDALCFLDEHDEMKGFRFDGRLSENFKLATGTWVSVGPLRQAFLSAFAPYAKDVVIAGHDRDEVCALVFPDIEACRALCAELAPSDPAEAVLRHETTRTKLAELLGEFARGAKGSSTRVVRLILLEEPPSIDANEITDKGSINQRAVLSRRAALVEALYVAPRPASVIAASHAFSEGPHA